MSCVVHHWYTLRTNIKVGKNCEPINVKNLGIIDNCPCISAKIDDIFVFLSLLSIPFVSLRPESSDDSGLTVVYSILNKYCNKETDPVLLVKNNNLNNIEILHGNLVEVIDGKADIVVANILAEIICILTDDVKRVLKDGGTFITSGIIHDRVDMVCEKLEATGFEVIEKNRDGEWNCIVAKLK